VVSHHKRVLKQNTGRQAAVINRILEARESWGESLPKLRHNEVAWNRLLYEVDKTIRVMPLWKLQTVASESLEFLYANVGSGNAITLKPGVAYCLRAFYPLIVDLVRGAWLRYIRRYNNEALGDIIDLAGFMFGTERGNLGKFNPILMDVQHGNCFYCRQPLRQNRQVDHFIPWSRYPVDLGHNFVLAHPSCNRAKSDHIAAEPHLEAWVLRQAEHGSDLSDAFVEAEITHDISASNSIARWAYGQVARTDGQVWVRANTFERLGGHWHGLFTLSG
jgi:hypothetical protein